MLLPRSVWYEANTPKWCRMSRREVPSLVIEQHGRKPSGVVVPYEDDNLVPGDSLLVVGGQRGLQPFVQVSLELFVGIRRNLPTREVQQHDGSLVLESLVEHEDVGLEVLGGLDQIVVGAVLPLPLAHRPLLLGFIGRISPPSSSSGSSDSEDILGNRCDDLISAGNSPDPTTIPMRTP
jgi:hypothetical protein